MSHIVQLSVFKKYMFYINNLVYNSPQVSSGLHFYRRRRYLDNFGYIWYITSSTGLFLARSSSIGAIPGGTAAFWIAILQANHDITCAASARGAVIRRKGSRNLMMAWNRPENRPFEEDLLWFILIYSVFFVQGGGFHGLKLQISSRIIGALFELPPFF